MPWHQRIVTHNPPTSSQGDRSPTGGSTSVEHRRQLGVMAVLKGQINLPNTRDRDNGGIALIVLIQVREPEADLRQLPVLLRDQAIAVLV